MIRGSLYAAVRLVLQIQALTIIGVFAVAWALAGFEEARSALIGGLVGFLPNTYFAARFGRMDPSKSAKEVVRSFYLGESVKLLITALLFVIVFQLPGMKFMPLFIGFISVIVVFWFALLLRI